MTPLRIGFLGFGEVGQTLAEDLIARGLSNLIAWDIQFARESSAPSKATAKIGIEKATSAAEAVRNVDIVISAVTAAQCVAAAKSVAAHIAPGTFFLDLNSVSPRTKQTAASVVDEANGRYVEAAVMSPIAPKRIGAPILLGGPHATVALPCLLDLGFSGASVFAANLGQASAAKMCRSIIVKGMEALLAESLATAHHFGVEQSVLQSLRDLLPIDNWPTLSRYMISRSILHGVRRAEEMTEVAHTVEEAGLNPWMSRGCVERQRWAATFLQPNPSSGDSTRASSHAFQLDDAVERLLKNTAEITASASTTVPVANPSC